MGDLMEIVRHTSLKGARIPTRSDFYEAMKSEYKADCNCDCDTSIDDCPVQYARHYATAKPLNYANCEDCTNCNDCDCTKGGDCHCTDCQRDDC